MTYRYALRLLAAGLAVGGAFDLLFNGKLPGISVVIFTGALLTALALALRWEQSRIIGANAWLLVALVPFAAAVAIHANGFLTLLNISAILMLLALAAIDLTRRSVLDLGLPALAIAPLQAPLLALVRGGEVTLQAARNDLSRLPRPERRRLMPLLRGALLAAPVVVVFAALLASADMVFADLLERILRLEFLERLAEWTGHGLVIAAVGFFAAGGLAYTVWRKASTGEETPGNSALPLVLPRFLGNTEALVLLNAVNALFFLFVLVQVPYLFGGEVNIQSEGFTYAAYARRGFAELVIVAVLTLSMVLLLSAVTRRDEGRQEVAFNLCSTILLILTAVILVSAFKRLWLYELAYGFTRMRIYPHVFMAWLGVLLAWFTYTLWRRSSRFAIGLLVVCLGFVITLDLLNPDDFIVWQNAARYAALAVSTAGASRPEREVDATYLTQLSADAVPALIALADASEGTTQETIEANLRRRAAQMEKDTSWRGWQSLNLSRSRAYQLLSTRYQGMALEYPTAPSRPVH
jgi:hypothetical protein